jgi:DNA-binding GntR family transcriptional regulator
LAAELRLPLQGDDSRAPIEVEAQSALGLATNESLIVIGRARYLLDDTIPQGASAKRAMHWAYLNPSRFPPTFLRDHDFEKESLIAIYKKYGFAPTSRDTTLRARPPTVYERNVLKVDMPFAVLEARQILYAQDSSGAKPFVLEYLHACYVNWLYTVQNR